MIEFREEDCAYHRLLKLHHGDEITIVGETKVKPGEYLDDTRLLCIRLNRRDKWWQFWKPKYKSSTFRYESNGSGKQVFMTSNGYKEY